MRCAVLGDPIAHSLSPVLHRTGYDALHLAWTYDAVRVPAGGLAQFLGSLDDSWRGLSLTMPLKREVLSLGSRTTDRAVAAGAANTVLLDGGSVLLDNTDLPGASAALRERYDGAVERVTVLGGGATAASTGLAMCDLGARQVRLLVRTPERARDTAARIAAHPSRPQVSVGGLDDSEWHDCEVLVSTVPGTAQTPELVRRAAAALVTFEVVYDPWPTPLARAALASGRILVTGLDLLVHQAALQFELFTDAPAPLEAMRAAGEAELAQRGPG